jgi:hypothetical protein
MRRAAAWALAALLMLAAVGAAGAAGAEPRPAPDLVLASAPAGDNESAARERAVARGLRQAVARAAVGMVDPATLRSRLDALEGKVLARAESFVNNYSLEASATSQGRVLVLVSVSVDAAALDQALTEAGLRLPAARQELTLVLVSEETAPGRPAVYWWSGNAGVPAMPPPVKKVLDSLGVRTVDPASLAGRIPPEARQPVLSEEQALELARMAGAGLVILGRVRTYPMVTPEGESPPPVAQLMALEVDSGQALALVEAEGPTFHLTPGPGATPAVEEAVVASVRQLLEQLAAEAPGDQAAGGEVLVKVRGLRSLADLMRFQEMLAGQGTLVAEVSRESVGAGRATLKVKLNGPPSQLADQLIVQDFGDFLVNVLEISPQELTLMLIPK